MGLASLRKQIDKLDTELVKIVAKRQKLVRKIGEYKVRRRIKLKDKQREKEIIEMARENARKFKADEKLAVDIIKKCIGKQLCRK